MRCWNPGLLLFVLLCACNEDRALEVLHVGGDASSVRDGGAGSNSDGATAPDAGDPNRFLGNGCRASDPEANAPWPTAAQGRARRSHATVAGPRRSFHLFSIDLRGGWLSAPVVATDGTIVVGTFDGHVHVLDGRSGARKWNVQLPGVVAGLTIGCGGELFVSSPPSIVSFDLHSGARRFTVNVGSVAVLNPGLAVSGNTLFVGTNDKTVLALDTQSGAVRWKYSGDTTFAPTAAVGLDGTLYVGSGGGRVHAFDGATGMLRWRSDDLGPINGYPVLRTEDELVVVTQRGMFRVATRDGTSSPLALPREGEPPAIGDDGSMAFGTDVSVAFDAGGLLFAANAAAPGSRMIRATNVKDGTTVWDAIGPAINQPPVIGADGIVYLTTFDGMLMAYGR